MLDLEQSACPISSAFSVSNGLNQCLFSSYEATIMLRRYTAAAAGSRSDGWSLAVSARTWSWRPSDHDKSDRRDREAAWWDTVACAP